MGPYSWTHAGTPSHRGHMDPVAATMPSQAHAGAAQEAHDIGEWEGQDVPLVRPSSCIVKGGIPSSRRYLPTYPPRQRGVSHEERAEETGRDPHARVPQERGRRDARRKKNFQILQNSFDDIILEQWVSMHLDHPHNGQYVRPEQGVYHRRDVGSVSSFICYTFSISVL